MVWSLVDQGVVSGGNFLINLLLARLLVPRSYGVFGLFYLAIIGANTFHSSVVTYWLNLFGAKVDDHDIKKLMTGALGITTVWLAPMSLTTMVACIVTHSYGLWLPATVALYCWQLQESARRALLCRMRYRSSVLPDALSYLGQAGVVALLRPSDLGVIFWIVAATSVAGLAWQLLLVGCESVTFLEFRQYFAESLRFGRFVVAANCINMLALQIPAWTLLRAGGQDMVAAFQALSNVVNVTNPLLLGVSNHVIPAVARVAQQGSATARRVALLDGFSLGAVLVVYLSALVIAPQHAMTLMYGHSSPYLVFASLLKILSLACLFQFVNTVVGAYEGGMGRTASYMKSQAAGLVALIAIGIPIIMYLGLLGAVIASVVSAFARAGVVTLISYRDDKKVNLEVGAFSANIDQSMPADI